MPVDIGGGKEPQTTEDILSYTRTEKIRKAVARKSSTTMAEECLNNRVIAKNNYNKENW